MPNPVINRRTLGTGRSSSLYIGLVSYWKLDDAANTTRLDSFGTNHLLDNVPDVGKSTAIKVYNAAADFHVNIANASERLRIPSNTSLAIAAGQSFSMSFWVYFNSIVNQAMTIGKWQTANEFLVWQDLSSNLTWQIRNAANNSSVGISFVPNPVPTGQWIHGVVGYDESLQVGFAYHNGGAKTSSSVVGVHNGTDDFTLGNYGGTGSSIPIDGYIDEVGFWKRVITKDEVKALFNGGAGKKFPF